MYTTTFVSFASTDETVTVELLGEGNNLTLCLNFHNKPGRPYSNHGINIHGSYEGIENLVRAISAALEKRERKKDCVVHR